MLIKSKIDPNYVKTTVDTEINSSLSTILVRFQMLLFNAMQCYFVHVTKPFRRNPTDIGRAKSVFRFEVDKMTWSFSRQRPKPITIVCATSSILSLYSLFESS